MAKRLDVQDSNIIGMMVGFGACHIVLDGDPVSRRKGVQQHSNPHV